MQSNVANLEDFHLCCTMRKKSKLLLWSHETTDRLRTHSAP